MTLKAGSKVYAPNGFESDGTTPHFEELTVSSDLSIAGGSSVQQVFIIIEYNLSSYNRLNPSYLASGTSNPGSGFYFWYDTTTNKIRYSSSANGTFDTNTRPFPIGLFTQGSGSITSINQVFNGFGYIGSTAFILPGIKCEVPNGRDVNGTCLNSIYTRTSLDIQTYTGSTTSFDILANADFILASGTNLVTYDSEKNLNTNNYFKLGEAYWNSGKCTGFKLKSVDSVANTNASNFSQAGRNTLIGWSIPLYSAGITLSNSTTNTITTKGWIQYTAIRTNAIGSVTVSGLIFQSGSSATNDRGSILIPVDIGDTVTVGVGGSSDTLYFFPCKGV